MHGELFPRFRDCMTEQPCDSFGSDSHVLEEWQGESEIYGTILGIEETYSTVAEFAEEVGRHLLKTQINKGKKVMDGSYYLSRFVSLSGDMRWTLHTSFQKHSRQNTQQESGMAIFDTKILLESGAQVFRVSDLLRFLDKDSRYGGFAIDALARVWAGNADEYICWDLIPKQALVKFVSCDTMAEGFAPENMFLRPEFIHTKSLGGFQQIRRIRLSTNNYTRRISLFLRDIMHEISSNTKGDHLIEYMATVLSDPYLWGYQVDDETSVKRKVLAVVTVEYAYGVGSWMDNDEFPIDPQYCADLHEFYLLKAERLLNG
jgi:hypothetical protein